MKDVTEYNPDWGHFELDLKDLREVHTKMRQDLSDLAHQVRVLREANRVLGDRLGAVVGVLAILALSWALGAP